MQRRMIPMQITSLGEREVEIRMMTGGLKDDGYDLMPEGCQLDGYLLNPIQLWQHSPDHPVASNSSVRISGGAIEAHCTFAPAGISAKADEVCGLVKAGVVRACSIGFDVLERVAIDPRDPRAGWRVPRWALLECSFVSVPLDQNAGVTARAQGDREMADWKCGAARDLPIQDGDPAWDGSAAEAAIFEWAGGDEFDAAKARQGFLAYDAVAPELRGSYKLPFCNVTGGKLEVPKSAIRAASGAHGVGAADIGDAKEEAQTVLDHYKEKAGIGEGDGDGRARRRRVRSKRQGKPAAPKIRGMYGIAQLAWVLSELEESRDMAEFEMALEGDDSKLPAMLSGCLQSLGEALIAMTEEEVAELVSGTEEMDDGDDMLADGERALLAAAKTPAMRNFLRGKFRARAALTASRAGAALSAANAAKIGEAEGHHAKAMEHHRAADEAHAVVGEHHAGIRAGCDAIQGCRDDMAGEMDGDAPDTDRMRGHMRKLTRALDAVSGHIDGATDEHEAVGDSQRGIARSVRAANRCLRAVDGYEGEGEMAGDQGSAGETAGASDGRATNADHDFRRRQAEILRLGTA